ncbi:MAG: hypothetical protein HEP71_24645 [Roseivirga sp.]|nr:hypothetical protein [Roseivirga sp.]
MPNPGAVLEGINQAKEIAQFLESFIEDHVQAQWTSAVVNVHNYTGFDFHAKNYHLWHGSELILEGHTNEGLVASDESATPIAFSDQMISAKGDLDFATYSLGIEKGSGGAFMFLSEQTIEYRDEASYVILFVGVGRSNAFPGSKNIGMNLLPIAVTIWDSLYKSSDLRRQVLLDTWFKAQKPPNLWGQSSLQGGERTHLEVEGLYGFDYHAQLVDRNEDQSGNPLQNAEGIATYTLRNAE